MEKLSLKMHNVILTATGAIIFYITSDIIDNQDLLQEKKYFHIIKLWSLNRRTLNMCRVGKYLANRPVIKEQREKPAESFNKFYPS